MVINLGQDPWILILLTFLEILLILVPAFIASKIERTSLHQEIFEMGFNEEYKSFRDLFTKILVGASLGIGFFLFGRYIYFFFRTIIVENLFGTEFVDQAQEGAISTQPIEPNFIQILFIIILNIFVVAICEEAFFRGFIIKKLENKIPKWGSIFLSSIFFSLYHVPPFLVPLTTIITFSGYYFTFGMILGVIFKIYKNSLIPVIISHALFNTLLLIF
ncbi:MAG: CPBP family intramembrane glutamic endopeptidase [Promethearchaeota archaeon]